MPEYKQLPLTGNQNDYYLTETELIGLADVRKVLSKFYSDNKEFNPRQLHYIVTAESNDKHLDVLLGI